MPDRGGGAPCPGFELLYQPEVVRLYLSLLTESRNFNTLEAAAGALQNLSAGNWVVRGPAGQGGLGWSCWGRALSAAGGQVRLEGAVRAPLGARRCPS